MVLDFSSFTVFLFNIKALSLCACLLTTLGGRCCCNIIPLMGLKTHGHFYSYHKYTRMDEGAEDWELKCVNYPQRGHNKLSDLV